MGQSCPTHRFTTEIGSDFDNNDALLSPHCKTIFTFACTRRADDGGYDFCLHHRERHCFAARKFFQFKGYWLSPSSGLKQRQGQRLNITIERLLPFLKIRVENVDDVMVRGNLNFNGIDLCSADVIIHQRSRTDDTLLDRYLLAIFHRHQSR